MRSRKSNVHGRITRLDEPGANLSDESFAERRFQRMCSAIIFMKSGETLFPTGAIPPSGRARNTVATITLQRNRRPRNQVSSPPVGWDTVWAQLPSGTAFVALDGRDADRIVRCSAGAVALLHRFSRDAYPSPPMVLDRGKKDTVILLAVCNRATGGFSMSPIP